MPHCHLQRHTLACSVSLLSRCLGPCLAGHTSSRRQHGLMQIHCSSSGKAQAETPSLPVSRSKACLGQFPWSLSFISPQASSHLCRRMASFCNTTAMSHKASQFLLVSENYFRQQHFGTTASHGLEMERLPPGAVVPSSRPGSPQHAENSPDISSPRHLPQTTWSQQLQGLGPKHHQLWGSSFTNVAYNYPTRQWDNFCPLMKNDCSYYFLSPLIIIHEPNNNYSEAHSNGSSGTSVCLWS